MKVDWKEVYLAKVNLKAATAEAKKRHGAGCCCYYPPQDHDLPTSREERT
jgi:hypothetical protein